MLCPIRFLRIGLTWAQDSFRIKVPKTCNEGLTPRPFLFSDGRIHRISIRKVMKSGAPPISKHIRLFPVVRSGNGGGTCVFRDLTLLPKLILFPRRYCQLQISKKIGQRDVVVFTKDGYRIDGQRAFSAFCTTDVHSGVHRYAHLRQPSDLRNFQLFVRGHLLNRMSVRGELMLLQINAVPQQNSHTDRYIY